jgi:hypothetical protein
MHKYAFRCDKVDIKTLLESLKIDKICKSIHKKSIYKRYYIYNYINVVYNLVGQLNKANYENPERDSGVN